MTTYDDLSEIFLIKICKNLCEFFNVIKVLKETKAQNLNLKYYKKVDRNA